MPEKDALKISLETRLKMFAPHEQFGYGAYDIMINSFENNVFNSTFRGDGNGEVKNTITSLIDAKRAAYIYLNDNAGLLAGDNKSDVIAVSLLYKDMFDTLQSVVSHNEFFKGFDQKNMNEETRIKFANALRHCKELKLQVHGIVEKILENWGG